jgi:UMF1 family MFS transporter
MLHALNPFRGLPNPREVWAWTMYDAASQSFTLIINSVLFGVYLKEVVMVGEPAGAAEALWANIVAASLLAVCILAPVAGTIADERNLRKPFLIGVCLLCSVCTFALGFAGPGDKWLAVALYMPANFAYAMSNIFLSSFLPQVSTPRNMGRVSAIGWGSGYVSSLAMLALAYACMVGLGWSSPAKWGPLISGAGVWYLLLAIPTMLGLHEQKTPPQFPAGTNLVKVSLSRLAATAKSATRFRQLLVFLTIFFVFNLGVQTVVYFSSIIANDFGIKGSRLVLFMFPVSVAAGIGAVLTGVYQDRVGHRTTILVWLGVWSLNALAFLLVPKPPSAGQPSPQEWILWVASCGIGLGLGGIGSASRALVGMLTPAHKTAEFFSLWGLMYKLATLVGVFTFGKVKAAHGDAVAFASLAGVFVIGFLLMFVVDEKAGIAAAKDAEKAAGAVPLEPGEAPPPTADAKPAATGGPIAPPGA